MPATPPGPSEPVLDHFTSSGRTVRVERFDPRPPGRDAAVLLLHGADGLYARGATYRGMARDLAAEGYLVLIVHYFDSTGGGFGALISNPLQFFVWARAVRGAVGHARERLASPAPRVGVVGFSLGAYLALSAAAEDERIDAVVDCFGGFPQPFADSVTRLPPTLVLHGDADPVVPVSQAHELQRLLKRHAPSYEVHIYPGQGHGFHGGAARDALDRVLAFLGKHLLRPERAASA